MFWDLRAPSHSIRSIKTKSSLVHCFSAHGIRGLLACGSDDGVEIYSNAAELVSHVRFFDHVPGQAFGPVKHLSFHPYTSDLACAMESGEAVILGQK